jgi:hypothetical protein
VTIKNALEAKTKELEDSQTKIQALLDKDKQLNG